MWEKLSNSVKWILERKVKKMLKEIFALSDQGEKDLKKGILSSAAANISLILPAGITAFNNKGFNEIYRKKWFL